MGQARNLLVLCLCAAVSMLHAQTSLDAKIRNFVGIFDLNEDNVVTLAESRSAFSVFFDANSDGCITQAEWEAALSGAPAAGNGIDFSPEIARIFYATDLAASGGPQGSCSGITINNFDAPDFSRRFLISAVVMQLVDFCEADASGFRYLSNNDCRQLPLACMFGAEVSCSYHCLEYVINNGSKRVEPFSSPLRGSNFFEGSFETAFDSVVNGNDMNGNGVITRGEFNTDGAISDINEDGCVDRLEFQARCMFRRCGGYGLTMEAANARFDGLTNGGGVPIDPACNGFRIGSDTSDLTPGMSQSDFIDFTMATILAMCEEDRTRYQTNRDCNQLLFTCLYTKYRDGNTCKRYAERVILGEVGFFY